MENSLKSSLVFSNLKINVNTQPVVINSQLIREGGAHGEGRKHEDGRGLGIGRAHGDGRAHGLGMAREGFQMGVRLRIRIEGHS